MRRCTADHQHRNRRFAQTVRLILDLLRLKIGVGFAKMLGQQVAGRYPGAVAEDDEPPRGQLAVIGHPHADLQDLGQLLLIGARRP